MKNHLIDVTYNKLTLDSREVANMVGKNHGHLIRDIETYIRYMENPKMDSGLKPMVIEFFIEGTYQSESSGREYKKYDITKKGCEFIAHKLTGKKGTMFTATYINKFHQMESALQRPMDSYMIEDPIERAKAWIKEQEEKEQLKLTNRKQEQIIGELKPKADYTDTILKNPGLVTITQIAKDYGMSGQAMNSLLHDLKVQYKQSDQWLLYKDYHGKGYTHSQTIDIIRKDGTPDIKMNTKWTQKGRLFLYNLLKQFDILPSIEKEFKGVSVNG